MKSLGEKSLIWEVSPLVFAKIISNMAVVMKEIPLFFTTQKKIEFGEIISPNNY
jgi:hypothetical protein